MTDGPLIVWAADGEFPVGEGMVCAWNSYAVMDGVISVLGHVDENADRLRDRYLAWVGELGESTGGGRCVVDLLGIRRTNFSLWWMSSIFEKSFWNGPMVGSVVRLLALDEIFASYQPAEVKVVSDRPEVRQAVRRLAKLHGASCRMRRPYGVSPAESHGVTRVFTGRGLLNPEPSQKVLHRVDLNGEIRNRLLFRWRLSTRTALADLRGAS